MIIERVTDGLRTGERILIPSAPWPKGKYLPISTGDPAGLPTGAALLVFAGWYAWRCWRYG